MSPHRPEVPEEVLSEFAVQTVTPVGGGSIAHAYRADTPDGPVFVKTLPEPAPHFFECEALGLRALAVPGGPPVPAVRYAHERALVLDWIDTTGARPTDREQEDFGRRLAAVHSRTGPHFGSLDEVGRGYLGSVPIDLTPEPTWAASYLQRRVVPLARQAGDRGLLDASMVRQVDRLVDRPEVCGPPEPPTLVHGDLWPGNRVLDRSGRSWLIDPSAQYGHRELDLAVMRLFGGFGPRTHAAYEEVYPLAPDAERRVGVHQLAMVLVHVLLFGGGYTPKVAQALRSIA